MYEKVIVKLIFCTLVKKKIKRHKTNPNLRKFYHKTKTKNLTNALDKLQYDYKKESDLAKT